MSDAGRARVLQALYDLGPLSRAELSRLTGTSRAGITGIVQTMLDQGLLAEQDTRPSSPAGGKPSRPLWLSPEAPPIAAAHLLPGRVEFALVSAGGEVLSSSQREFQPGNREAASETLVSGLAQVQEAAGRPLLGVGVAVGGIVDTDTGTIVRIALAPELDGLPVSSLIGDRLGIPAHVDLHPRAQALGDRWFGQGRGRSHFASVYTGEALGVGLVIDGHVHRGPSGMGGEIGHSTVQAGGRRCHCGQTGCWETIAGHSWLREQAVQAGLPGAAVLTAGPLSRLAALQHPHAGELLDQWAANLSVGLANLQQIFAPGLFILHGDAVAGGEELRGRVESHLRARIMPHPAGPPSVTFTTLQDHATLLGAAGLVLSQQLHGAH